MELQTRIVFVGVVLATPWGRCALSLESRSDVVGEDVVRKAASVFLDVTPEHGESSSGNPPDCPTGRFVA